MRSSHTARISEPFVLLKLSHCADTHGFSDVQAPEFDNYRPLKLA